MKHRMIVLLVATALSAPIARAADEGLKPGVLAPRFALKTLDGKETVDSREFIKKSPVTVLILWDSYCPDCLATVKSCQKFADTAGDKGVQVLGINYDRENLAAVRGFLKAGKITFPNLHDRTGDTVRAYRGQAYDFSYFVIDGKGIVRFSAYDHPPEIEKELVRAVNQGLGASSPLAGKEKTPTCSEEESKSD